MSVFTLLTALWLNLTPASAQSLEDCGALNDLAERALMGALTIRERACLENVGDTSSTEVRNRLGRLLAINAWAKGDQAEWTRLSRVFGSAVEATRADVAAGLLEAERTSQQFRARLLRALHEAMQVQEPERSERILELYRQLAEFHGTRAAMLAAVPGEAGPGELEIARIEYESATKRWMAFARAQGRDLEEQCLDVTEVRRWCK